MKDGHVESLGSFQYKTHVHDADKARTQRLRFKNKVEVNELEFSGRSIPWPKSRAFLEKENFQNLRKVVNLVVIPARAQISGSG